MKRHSKVSGNRRKRRWPNASKPKHRSALKQATRSTPSAASEQGEIARLTRERDEALEQQTASFEVLGVISSSAGEVQRVFQSILEKATRICGAAFGSMLLTEADGFRRVALHNAPPALAGLHHQSPLA
jgi:hypothetical protein